MKVDSKKIEKVLAMFDIEDIPYINPKVRFKMISYNKTNIQNNIKIKRVGVYKNDRQRK